MKYGSLSKQPVFHGIRKGPQVFCLYRGSIDFLGILHPRTPRLCVRFHADSGPPPAAMMLYPPGYIPWAPKTCMFRGFYGK